MHQQIHIVQAGLIKPVLQGMVHAGVNLDSTFRHSGLDRFSIDDADNYLPIHVVYCFLEYVQKHHGIDCILGEFGHHIQLQSLSRIGETIACTPDVLAASQLASRYNASIVSNETLELVIKGNRAMLRSRFADAVAPGRDSLIHLCLAVILSGLRLAAGPGWAPFEIHVQTETMPDLSNWLPEGCDTRICLDQPFSGAVFSTSLLTASMLKNNGSNDLEQLYGPGMPAQQSQVESLLDSYQENHIPTLQQLSVLAGVPARTLQRRLQEEDTSYSTVVENWRFKSAIQLLEDPAVRVGEVAERLSYANTPNFERAFRRWTGTTPLRYRAEL